MTDLNMSAEIWTKLKSAVKPIVLYGMGDGADKILKVFERYDITVSAVFASDEFVRGHSFHGFKVMKLAEVSEMFDDFIIIVSFATALPDVLERVYELSQRYELYVPDVPVVGDELFNIEFYNDNLDKINNARELLYDNESKAVFDDIINYKLSGEIKHLINSQSSIHNILRPLQYTSYADLGAYNGDTVRDLISKAPNLKYICAFEPDTRNFKKLSLIPDITAYNIAAWNKQTTLVFDRRGGRNSRIGRGDFEVEANSLDNILQGRQIDYIKYDVEGAEYEALTGSAETIKKYSPDLTVSLYHRSGDIFELVSYVHKLNPAYKLYLRRYPYIPAWDLNLYAIN
jgi:methyltransferase, FkbM family